MNREKAATLHLQLWLGAFHRTLAAATGLRHTALHKAARSPAPAHGIAPQHADALLSALKDRVKSGPPKVPPVAFTDAEERAHQTLLRNAPTKLPLTLLTEIAGLNRFDITALLTVIASEIAPELRPLYGYLHDDMARYAPSIELVLALSSHETNDFGSRRRRIGPGGPLRRLGLITAIDTLSSDMTNQLAPAAGLVEWLLGASAAPPVPLTDPRLILPEAVSKTMTTAALDPAKRCLRMAANAATGLWGEEPNRHDDFLAELARDIGRPVMRTSRADTFEVWWAAFRQEAAIAAGMDAILWIDTRNLPSGSADLARVGTTLANLPQRIVLTGRRPWRPLDVVATRPYADIALPHLQDAVHRDWGLPAAALAPETAAELGAQYRLGYRARRAATQVALSDVRNNTNGSVPDISDALSKASKMLATPAQMPSVRVITPERTLDDLILAEGQHAQIAEMGDMIAHARKVDGSWGFGRLTGSTGALKALFTGDPGTGKTLAAEVAAHGAGVSLMKVDLSQVVSKWVGETEKNLEAVFDHAEQSRAALFFDEADALFGKRGEVRHGTDRYANLEVSYLLQRLESYSGGLLILASNLREEIDPAFTRRFQIAMHFQRPGPTERLRLWQKAFANAPIAPGLDLNTAASHDLTGGSIVTSARMAALLAAKEDAQWISQAHIDQATERQFRKEARLMTARHPNGLSVAQGRA